MTKNTSYKVQVDVDSDAIRNQYNIEEGAFVTTESGVWTVYNGEWVKLHPQSATSSGLGWVRYDDDQYTSASKLSLANGVETTLTNNGANIVRSEAGIDYYDTSTNKLLATTPKDVYIMTVVFNYSSANANQTFLHLNLDNAGATPYSRLKQNIIFPKGNDVTHEYHGVFQYYVDQDFIDNGSSWKIIADGGTAKIWDIIYFIQKTQSYA
jgi:hypothetical protein